jgi:hypothetical protein
VGEDHFKIPKPFEVGVIFGMIPERLLRMMQGHDDWDLFRKRMTQALAETFALNPVPQLVKPMVEQFANKDMFRGNSIVNINLQGREPEAQYAPWTSETARKMAELVPDQVAGIETPEAIRSPVRIEHLVRAYTGTLGSYVLRMSDMAARKLGGLPNAPAPNLSNVPVVSRIYAGKRGEGRSNRYRDMLYDALDVADDTYRTVNAYAKEGRVEQARELRLEKKHHLRARKQLHAFNTRIKALNERSRLIRSHPTMGSEEKREKLTKITRSQNQLLRQAAPLLDSL